ncbi:MAG: hypothetical protein AB7O45_15755, partial [Alphaproteobacteria bacterium]
MRPGPGRAMVDPAMTIVPILRALAGLLLAVSLAVAGPAAAQMPPFPLGPQADSKPSGEDKAAADKARAEEAGRLARALEDPEKRQALIRQL